MAQATLESLRKSYVTQYKKAHPGLTVFQANDRANRAFRSARHKSEIPKRLQGQWEKKYGFSTPYKKTYNALRKEIGTPRAKTQIKKLNKIIADYKRAKKRLERTGETDYGPTKGITEFAELRDTYWDLYYDWFIDNFGVPPADYPMDSP